MIQKLWQCLINRNQCFFPYVLLKLNHTLHCYTAVCFKKTSLGISCIARFTSISCDEPNTQMMLQYLVFRILSNQIIRSTRPITFTDTFTLLVSWSEHLPLIKSFSNIKSDLFPNVKKNVIKSYTRYQWLHCLIYIQLFTRLIIIEIHYKYWMKTRLNKGRLW